MVPAPNEPTVITIVDEAGPHIPVHVSDIVTVPGATPVTTPVLLTVAIEASLLLHTPPPKKPELSVSAIVDPTHTSVGPEILSVGVAMTVSTISALHAPTE